MASIQGKRSREKCQRVWLLLKSPPSTLDQNERSGRTAFSKGFRKVGNSPRPFKRNWESLLQKWIPKKKVVFLLVQYLLLLASWKRRFYIPYHPQLLHHYLGTLYIPITISTSRKYYIVVGLLSKKDVRDDDVARCTEQQDCSMKLQVNVRGHLESAFSIAI